MAAAWSPPRRRWWLALLLAATFCLLSATSAFAQSSVRVLVFHGPTDAVNSAGVSAIQALGSANAFTVDETADATQFNASNLARYRAVVFLDNKGDLLSAAQESALQAFIQAGGGFVGIGGAAEAEPTSTFVTGLIGSRPDASSSPTASDQVVVFGDRVHPATKDLPLQWTRNDIWYRWNPRPTGTVHTVARYHAVGAPAGDGTATGGTDWPISWCRDFQGGRSFYTGMGRTEASYAQADFRKHLLGALQWAAGLVRGGCKATIMSNYSTERLVSAASGDLTNSGESHGVSLANNGWAIYIGRADCRTDAERGKMIGQASSPRILDFANRNVGVGCGTIHVWDPKAANGTVNSGVTQAAVLPVYGDRGGGNEVNGKIETGLIGVAAAPDFATTGHIYLQYFPTFNPDNPVHPGLIDGDQRRITKMEHARISRFTINLQTKKLDLNSEVVIFEYDSQVYSCCHRGGGMAFDSEGNLYVTTGDSNSSQSTNGYSGNYQPQRCPTGDPTVASNNHCGNNPVSFNDARRTAGNTNDYNGKMLRFNPIENLADGSHPTPGVGTTYTLPTASSPNGPNLFDGTEGGGGKTKPEIYAMGLRNPSRMTIDPATDIPYAAWVGPDAGAPSSTQGPSTYETATQLPTAGNYGWPYCMGNRQPYRDRIADGSLRTTNGPGFVTGGPASAPTNGWYDCNNLVNDSTNNTGLVTLPHVTGTGKDAGTAHSNNVWYSRGNPNNANGCPDFPREQGAGNGPNYGANPTQLCPYLISSGATVFTGPFYRYKEGADNSARWPKYWDGRWFLNDFGNNSAKHALLLDPASDQDGSQPIYADSFRGALPWGANYMDSKFGPDGALYVQVYEGFFTTGSGAGLYRFKYTGGPDTPGADPQWSSTSTARQIAFGLGASGGVSYEWDFGDGSAVSTSANPSHTYAADGAYDAKLTVTYADGAKDSKTVHVLVGADTAAPSTVAQIDGATPAPKYSKAVEVTLTAADGGAGTGVDWIEHRIDGGAWVRDTNTASAEPFVAKFTVSGNGNHTVEYRARDKAGNVSDPPGSVSFQIDLGTGGGGACLPQSDEFDGTALDSKWTVTRSAGGGPVVSGGTLKLPLLQGDFIANDALASNTVLETAPDGEWTATAKVDTTTLDANGEQAGIVIWKSENPNTFSKVMAIRANSGAYQFEHIVTQNGSVNPPIPSSITPAPGGTLPATVLLRARSNGTNIVGEFSADNGQTWTKIGNETHSAPFSGALKIGPVAFRGSQGGGTASFDWFRVMSGSDPNTPIECSTGCSPLSDQFNGTTLDPKWALLNPVPGSTPTVSNGHLHMPIVPGDLFGDTGNAQMILQQSLPGSWVATAKIKHAAIDRDGEAAGLALINSFDPNNFVKTAVQYKADTDPNTPGDQPGKWAERVVTSNGSAVTIPPATVPWPNSGALSTAGDYIFVRFVYDALAKEVTTWTSTNGTTFTSFGAPISVSQYLGAPGGFRVGLFAKHDGGENDVVDIDAFNVVVGTSNPQTRGDDCGGTGGGCPQVDQFDGTALDPKWEIANPTPANLAVGGGNLTLTSAVGDVSGANFTARNILLQAVPQGPWTVTTKLDPTAIAANGQAAGLVLYGSNSPNYLAKTAIQYKTNDLSGQPMNGIWAERVLTINNAISNAYGGSFPNTGKLTPTGNALWLRASYDGTNVSFTYSLDGTTFATTAPSVPASAFGANGITKIGLFAKHDNGGTPAAVKFDSFTVEAQSCGGQDTSAPRTTHVLAPATPDGDGGYYKSDVKVTLNATDNDGGSGVDHTEYREAGAANWTAYSAPFNVTSDGSHTIEYRSVDKKGNVESTRSVTLKIDKTGPATTAKLNGAAPKASYDGDVAVDLDATDATSGVKTTEIRVDGGAWKPYVEEETILGSQADLARWAQAGPGGLTWVDQEGGFARTQGGLGMPWYPVKDYGDFSIKLQWRDSGAGSTGNGGVFLRFPNPTEAVTRTAANRYPCQVGSAQSDPAWVAIYCGHEFQINDNQASEPQKTGSVYNFSPLDATQAKVQPKNTWVDYEIRVVGQTFTILRNGEVLQTFQNAPGKTSSRAGDPSTTDRQFTRGYIGLQNHSTNDQIDYRNIRVLSLDAGSARGPVTVSGNGAHTVEYRSTDVAGNVEATKKVEFTIGAAGGDTTAPVTTSTLAPASPGAGGTYNGPVSVQLSATDPASSGGGTPKTVDVNAAPDHWEPNALNANVGDTVRWNFPASAGTVHDLWVIKPGESPTSDGTRLSNIVLPGGEPVSQVVDAAGTWTFLCKVHSHKAADGWQGMVGTVTVAQGGGETPGSGVDYTEYRVNTNGATGDWVRKDNTSSANPFVTTVPVTAVGSHVVEYRSKDKAGNTEAIKSVAFSIASPAVSDSKDTDVSADVPLVMSISLAGSATFAPLIPGVAKDYTASMTATVTSSAPGSSLTVVDPSTTAPGHLVNGELALPQPLQAAAGGPFAPISGTPTVLKSWNGPLANDPVGLEFKQPIAATDKLATGHYGKRITFTLSSTLP